MMMDLKSWSRQQLPDRGHCTVLIISTSYYCCSAAATIPTCSRFRKMPNLVYIIIVSFIATCPSHNAIRVCVLFAVVSCRVVTSSCRYGRTMTTCTKTVSLPLVKQIIIIRLSTTATMLE